MELGPGEPAAGPWQVVPIDVLARSVADACVPVDASTVIIEGVGASRRELAPLIDVPIWVRSDFVEAKTRGLRRDMAELGRSEDEALQIWDDWEAEEMPFLAADQPWHRAKFIAGAASSVPHDPATEVAVSPPLAK
jgi:hypothetical protein